VLKPAKKMLFLAAFTLTSCTSQVIPAATPTSNTASLRLYATSATAPLAQDLIQFYEPLNVEIQFETRTSNYQNLVTQVTQSPSAYFLTTHLPPDAPLWAAPLGQDGIAVVLHPDNPIQTLSSQQIRDVFQGYITDWSAVGGENRPIQVISREAGAGTRYEFERQMMGERRTTTLAQVAPSNEAMRDMVRYNPNAIGYLSTAYQNALIKTVAVDNVLPTPETLRNNTYPLRSTLFIVGEQEPEGEYRLFIAWIQSPAGQTVVARYYTPLSP
jgi:phosphate transport system substrate-binding protein